MAAALQVAPRQDTTALRSEIAASYAEMRMESVFACVERCPVTWLPA